MSIVRAMLLLTLGCVALTLPSPTTAQIYAEAGAGIGFPLHLGVGSYKEGVAATAALVRPVGNLAQIGLATSYHHFKKENTETTISFVPLGVVLRGRLVRVRGFELLACFAPAIYVETITFDQRSRENNSLLPRADTSSWFGFAIGLRVQRDFEPTRLRLFADLDYTEIASEVRSSHYLAARLGVGLSISSL